MRLIVGLLLIVTAVCANPVLRWQEEQQIPVEVVEIPEPIVFVAPVQSLRTIESVQEVEEPEPIAISNEIIVPLVEEQRPEKEQNLKKIANALEKNPSEEKEIIKLDKPKLEKEEKIEEAKLEESKPEDEQRKDDQLQVETVQSENFVKKILPAPENLQPVPDVPQEVEGEISSEVKQLTPAEIDANVAPDTDDNGLRQDPTPQGLPATTKAPPQTQPPNLIQQLFTNPLQAIQNTFNGQSTVAPVADGSTQPPNFLQQGINQVQTTFQNSLQGIQQGFAGLQNQLSSIIPSTQAQQTQAQADTPVGDQTTRPPFNPIQSIQTALSNLLPSQSPSAAQQEGQQPVSQGPLSGILNLFSPTRAPTTYSPQPTAAQLSSSAPQFDAVTEIKEPQRGDVSFDSVESEEESGEISVVRDAEKDEKKEEKKEDEKKEEKKEVKKEEIKEELNKKEEEKKPVEEQKKKEEEKKPVEEKKKE